MKLFYLLLGATPIGRNTEQHDVFFGIANALSELAPALKKFWPEAGNTLHLDGFQEVRFVDGFAVKIVEKTVSATPEKLFFINLGGYRKGSFEEFHERHLMVGNSLGEVIKRVKKTDFYRTMGFANAGSHVDDKYGVDIDEIFEVNDILPEEMKSEYSIILEKSDEADQQNPFSVGYFKLNKL